MAILPLNEDILPLSLDYVLKAVLTHPDAKLVRTYQITFCIHNIFKCNEYITEASLRTKTGLQISDQIHLTIIELSKLGDILNKPIEEMTPIEMWSTFIRYSDDPAKRDLINKVLERKGEIGMAATVLAAISKDEHKRAKRMSQRKWETDMTNNLIVAEERGEKKGEKKGRTAERKKWQNVIASKDAKLADKDAEIARLRAMIKE